MSINVKAKPQVDKRLRSPGYLVRVKRGIQLIEGYNTQYCKGKLQKGDIREFVEYFALPLDNSNRYSGHHDNM